MNIDQICNNYDFVLVDTCAFMGCLRERPLLRNSNEKFMESQSNNDILSFWIKNIPIYSQIQSIKEVIEEIPSDYKYRKTVKHGSGRFGKRAILDLRRLLNKESMNRRKLLTLLEENNRILSFGKTRKNEQNYLINRYNFLIEKGYLSNTDLNLLATGVVLASRNRTCIISNDFNLISFWNKLTQDYSFYRNRFNLYLNKGCNKFEATFLRN